MAIKTYRNLEVWQRSVTMVQAIYELSGTLPSNERYGLCSQLQRAAVSVAANIAEGYGRLHRAEYVHHLSIARGSLFEVETLLTIVGRLNLVSRENAVHVWALAQEVGQMLHKLIAALRKTRIPNPEPRIPEPQRRQPAIR